MSTVIARPPEGAAGETSGFLEALRARIWIPLVCAAVLGGGAYLVASQRHRDYQAAALLQVNDANIEQDIIGITSSNLSFENVVAQIPPQVHQLSVAQQAAVLLRPHPTLNAQQVLAATSVSVDQQTGLIPVTAKAAAPQDAANIANALASAYVGLRQSTDLSRIHSARLQLQAIATARARANLRNPAAASALSSLTDRIEQLQLTEQIRPRSVALARPATPPSSRSGLAPGLIGAFGGLVGLVLGLGLVALMAQSDDRLRSVRDLERAFGVPVLARVPRSRALARREPVSQLGPRDGEPFRLLLARLRHGQGSERARSIALTSAAKGEGKSTTAWYLAAMAAASGTRTVLVEADQARPSSVPVEGASQVGLNELLTDVGVGVGDVAVGVDVGEGRRLDVIRSGSPGATAHLSGPDDVARVLASLEAYDLVIIETPPLPIAANAVPFVRGADGVLVVCRNGVIDRERAETLREALDGLDTRVFGLVAVGFGRGDRYP